MRGVRLFCGVVAFAIAACGQTRALDPAAIEHAALADLRAANTPGAAVAVVSGDRVVFTHAYGIADVENQAPVTSDMLFRLGSTTKMFTAASVVSLAVEGRLDLEAPVSRYISGLDPSIGRITANQLLSHTSGLHDEAPMFGSHDETALGLGIRAWKPDFFFTDPGRIYSYSNPAFWLAGFLAESVNGKPYADVIEERLFRPLGMKRSTLRPTMAMTWPLAQGHEVRNGQPEVIHPAADNAASWPAGSIFSNVQDLSRFVIAFMNDGRVDGRAVLVPKVITLMSSPHARIPGSPAAYGYGLQLETRRGVHWVEHGGSRAGYGSLIRMAPERKFAVIIVANRTGASLPKLADTIAEAMLPLEPERATDAPTHAPTHALTPAELRLCAGAYVNGPTRITLEISNGELQAGGGLAKARYGRAGEGFLVADGTPTQRLVLVPDAQGRIEYIFSGGRSFRRTN